MPFRSWVSAAQQRPLARTVKSQLSFSSMTQTQESKLGFLLGVFSAPLGKVERWKVFSK